MPLIQGKSKKSFEKNIKTEMDHGHPQKQSLAIAYSMKRKADKKMAEGGPVASPTPAPSPVLTGAQSTQDSMRKAFKFAEGGHICAKCGHQAEGNPHTDGDLGPGAHKSAELESGFVAHEGNDRRPNSSAIGEDDRSLGQHGKTEEGPGDSNSVPAPDEDDLVNRIMTKRSQDFSGEARYSEGGMIANQEHGENNNELAGFSPNEFDDLVLRDDLSSSYGDDDNSGDALGNAQEDEDRSDIVSRIMASRRKKDRNPRPA